MMLGSTDPTYRTLGKQGLVVRDNCGRVSFRVRSPSASRALFEQNGAEHLPPRQFMADLEGELVRGVAFDAPPERLQAFLTQRPVQALPKPE